MYIENEPPRYTLPLVTVVFAVALLAHSWLPELSSEEARHIAMAQEMSRNGNFLVPAIHGVPILMAPMMAWCVWALEQFMPVNEFTVRLLSIAAVWLLGLSCGLLAWRAAGWRPASATVAAVVTCIAIHSVGARAEHDVLFALLINVAWFAWFVLSRERRRWLPAWSAAHVLVGLAMLVGGIKAIFYFYFPLLLLRRPLDVRRRLRTADHIIPLCALLLFVVLWAVFLGEVTGKVLPDIVADRSPTTYLRRLLAFPVSAVGGFLPWAALVWPAFCLAFRPLEKRPALGQFLRVTVISLFVVFWLLPGGRPGLLLPLVGPLSILMALNYELLIRRHGQQLLFAIRAFAWAALAAAVLSLLLICLAMIGQLPTWLLPKPPATSLLFVLLAIGCAGLTLQYRRNGVIWICCLLTVCAWRLTLVSTVGLFAVAHQNSTRAAGAELAKRMPATADVYKLGLGSPESLARIGFYMGRALRHIGSLAEIPVYEHTVYVLTRNQTPLSTDRNWEQLGEPVFYSGRRQRLPVVLLGVRDAEFELPKKEWQIDLEIFDEDDRSRRETLRLGDTIAPYGYVVIDIQRHNRGLEFDTVAIEIESYTVAIQRAPEPLVWLQPEQRLHRYEPLVLRLWRGVRP